MENVHPSLIDAMKLDAPSWKRGSRDSIITTASGSIYYVDSRGTLVGGSHLTGGRTARLSGAVYRRGGPIRMGHIVVGLCIEAMTSDSDKRVLVTSPVESIRTICDLKGGNDGTL